MNTTQNVILHSLIYLCIFPSISDTSATFPGINAMQKEGDINNWPNVIFGCAYNFQFIMYT